MSSTEFDDSVRTVNFFGEVRYWPWDEVLHLPWWAVAGLTHEEKTHLHDEAVTRGHAPPRPKPPDPHTESRET